MKRLLILAVILAAGAAFGQSSFEPEHSPTEGQCSADSRLWRDILAEQARSDDADAFSTEARQTSIDEWLKRVLELETCAKLRREPLSIYGSYDRFVVPAIESELSGRFQAYLMSSRSRMADYQKWESAQQAKARRKVPATRTGK
jgi:hypothetical protein